jgi:hypothetical protein
MTSRRLTRVQQDVVDRMKAGWELYQDWKVTQLRKDGEPSRHVADRTVWSLRDRELIYYVSGNLWRLA